MRRKPHARPAAVAPLVAISLVAILGVVAIVLDGGLLLDDKRCVQAATDAAALAAADDLFANYGTNNGLDPSGTALASADLTAAANGYSNDGVTSVVTVNIPPAAGNFKGKAGYAEVIITYYQKRGFSNIFGAGDLPVQARAVARGIPNTVGLLILDPSLSDSAEIDGNVNILNGGQIWINSDDPAACQVASTSTLQCGGLNIVGGLTNNGSITYTNAGGLKTGVSALPDPLASIPEPTTSGLTTYGNVTITTNTTLSPGIYTSIIIQAPPVPKGSPPGTVMAGPAVTLSPGIYYMGNGGSLKLTAGSLQGTGVMLFDNTGGDSILNTAGGPVNLTPPTGSTGGTWPTGTTSATYNGISFWIPRAQTKEIHIESTFNLTMSGTWYAQGGEYDIRPDGATTVFNIGNYICDQAEWGQGYSSSKSNGIININPGSAAPTLRPKLVE